ncbi:MAG: anti-sigma factor domain-containing protein [Bacillota bacterium]
MKYEGSKLQNLLAGEYVLGLLGAGARRRFERLLMESPGLRAEVAAWEVRFTAWSLELPPVVPPDYLWWRILGAVRREEKSRRGPAGNNFWRVWAVAATLVLAVVLVSQRYVPATEQKPAEFALVSDAKGQPRWVISVHPEDKRIDMKALTSNPPPAGKSYELWMLPDQGNPVPMGLMNETGTASEHITAELLARLATAKGLAISVEPPGGSPTGLPTGQVVYTAVLVSG